MAKSLKQLDTITVHKSGLITGIGRYTEIPFAALDLQESNLGLPEDEGEERKFQCTRSSDNTALMGSSSTTGDSGASEGHCVRPEDWETVGRDFKVVGNDIWTAILNFHASQYSSPTEGQEE